MGLIQTRRRMQVAFRAAQSQPCRQRALACLAVGWISLLTMLWLPGTASASNPVTTTTLPLASYRDMVVDPTTNRVFVSGGPGTSTIVVLDFDGNITGTIADEPGASDMVLNPATSRLYVALLDDGSTSIINSATLAEVERKTGALGWNPVLAGGRIWYSPGYEGLASLALDLTDPATYVNYGTYPGSLAMLASASANPNVLAAGAGGSPSSLFTYDVTGGTPSLLAASGSVGGLGDVALTPDGTHLFVSEGAPLEEFRTSDLEFLANYDTGGSSTGVDVSPNGGLIAGAIETWLPAPGNDVFVFAPGDANAHNRYVVGSATGGLYGTSLTFAPDGKSLFAVTTGSEVAFHVLHDADLYGSTLTLGATTPYVKQPVTLSGDLTLMDGIQAADVPVKLTLVDGSGTRTPIATVNTDSSGHYSYVDPVSLPAVGTYTYEATWDGDDTHGSAIATKTVQAKKATATLKVTLSDHKIKFGQSVQIGVRLSGGLENRQVALYAQDVHGARTLLVAQDVDENGRLSLGVKPKANTKYVGEYAGDDAFSAATALQSVSVAVITTTRLRHYYAISDGYRLYHAGQDPLQVGKVVPNHAGKRLRFPIQARVRGHWVLLAAPRFRIEPNGTAAVRWLDPVRGYSFRVRNIFDGDADHLGDTSPWVYFRVT